VITIADYNMYKEKRKKKVQEIQIMGKLKNLKQKIKTGKEYIKL